MAIQKNFRFTDEMVEKFTELKVKEKVETDTELLKRLLDCAELLQQSKNELKEKEQNTIALEKYEELQRQYQALLIELGRLQGELNIYKQQALENKKPWWKFW